MPDVLEAVDVVDPFYEVETLGAVPGEGDGGVEVVGLGVGWGEGDGARGCVDGFPHGVCEGEVAGYVVCVLPVGLFCSEAETSFGEMSVWRFKYGEGKGRTVF